MTRHTEAGPVEKHQRVLRQRSGMSPEALSASSATAFRIHRMATHKAACSCGQLRLIADGDPIRVSICHCLECQRRTGSVFGVQARFDAEQLRTEGRSSEYVRISDDGEERIFSFCPECGGTVFFKFPTMPDMIAVPVGVFADPNFPMPIRSIYETRRHPWVQLPDGIEHEA